VSSAKNVNRPKEPDGRCSLGETCATAYQFRVYDCHVRLEGDSRYGDLMERIIYNALFAAQSPDGRRIRYYTIRWRIRRAPTRSGPAAWLAPFEPGTWSGPSESPETCRYGSRSFLIPKESASTSAYRI
jgi:hypothetical protein